MLDKQDDIDGGPKRNMTEMIGVPESRSGRTPERRRMARETEEAKRMSRVQKKKETAAFAEEKTLTSKQS